MLRYGRRVPLVVKTPSDGSLSDGSIGSALSAASTSFGGGGGGSYYDSEQQQQQSSMDVEALQRLNSSLVAALRAERLRSRALQDKLDNHQEAAADTTAAPPAAAEACPPAAAPPPMLARAASMGELGGSHLGPQPGEQGRGGELRDRRAAGRQLGAHLTHPPRMDGRG